MVGRPRALWRPHPQAPIGQREAAGDEYDHGAKPDQTHERIEIEPHAIGAILELIAKHRVKIAPPARMDTGVGGGASLDGELAFGGLKLGHLLAVARHLEQPDPLPVVGPSLGHDALEG